jgi:hypothetical protein
VHLGIEGMTSVLQLGMIFLPAVVIVLLLLWGILNVAGWPAS